MVEMFLRKIPEDMRPWECNVNGVKYVYPAGTEQNVPAEVAALIDAYWEKQAVDYPETGISFNDLKDKPFYSEVVESVDVEVKEQTITSVTNSSGKHNAKLYNEDTGLVATKDNTHVIVVFDGELFDLRSNNNLLGNRAILGVAGAVDTGEPFHIVTGNSVTNIYTKTPGDHTIAITVYKEETVYHTIDPKFLPGGGGGGVVIVQDSAMASGVAVVGQAPTTATMNAAQIAEAVQAGKTVYFLTPTDDAVLLPLAYIYLYPALVSGAMTVSALPKPYVQFGAISESGYVSYNVNPDGSYYQASPMD